MPEFKDLAKSSKDLFKKPYNVGKIDVDIKAGSLTVKNSIAGEKVTSSVEHKGSDVMQGLVGGFAIPYTKKFDGKVVNIDLKFPSIQKEGFKFSYELKNAMTLKDGDVKANLSATYENAALGVIAGVESDCQGKNPKFHATKEFAACGYALGVSGGLSGSDLNYALVLPTGFVLETDLKKWALHGYKAYSGTSFGISAGWTANSAETAFAVAAKRRLASGADFHVKSDLSGKVDLAHVSSISEGVKLTMSASLSALNFEAPAKFGAGFEFSF